MIDQLSKESKSARKGLMQMGLIKTTWGWLYKNRVDALVEINLIRTSPILGYTKEGSQNGSRILQYLQGNIDTI